MAGPPHARVAQPRAMTTPLPRRLDALAVGERVFLRHPVPADRDELLSLRAANRSHLEKWEPKASPGFDAFGLDWVNAFLATRRGTRGERSLVCRIHDGAILGQISFNTILRGPLQQCFLGWWIGAAHEGGGNMTEAVRLACHHAFTTLGLHRVEANIVPTNARSRALAERAGLKYEGYSPRYLEIAGVWTDHERWALTLEDWIAQRSTGRTHR
jgi:[ribosomal protein S5]-alanine N-acetyltransferase